MFPDYFYILFLIIFCTFLGCLVHDCFMILLDEFCKYVNQQGYNGKTVIALVGFLAFMVLILALPPAVLAYAATV